MDPAFGHSLDCLIMLDLRLAPLDVLSRYLSLETIERVQAEARRGAG
ncbi:MAG: hypothetical protein QM718_06265 [Steroidobacteraceae bacterium]